MSLIGKAPELLPLEIAAQLGELLDGDPIGLAADVDIKLTGLLRDEDQGLASLPGEVHSLADRASVSGHAATCVVGHVGFVQEDDGAVGHILQAVHDSDPVGQELVGTR